METTDDRHRPHTGPDDSLGCAECRDRGDACPRHGCFGACTCGARDGRDDTFAISCRVHGIDDSVVRRTRAGYGSPRSAPARTHHRCFACRPANFG